MSSRNSVDSGTSSMETDYTPDISLDPQKVLYFYDVTIHHKNFNKSRMLELTNQSNDAFKNIFRRLCTIAMKCLKPSLADDIDYIYPGGKTLVTTEKINRNYYSFPVALSSELFGYLREGNLIFKIRPCFPPRRRLEQLSESKLEELIGKAVVQVVNNTGEFLSSNKNSSFSFQSLCTASQLALHFVIEHNVKVDQENNKVNVFSDMKPVVFFNYLEVHNFLEPPFGIDKIYDVVFQKLNTNEYCQVIDLKKFHGFGMVKVRKLQISGGTYVPGSTEILNSKSLKALKYQPYKHEDLVKTLDLDGQTFIDILLTGKAAFLEKFGIIVRPQE